MQWPYKVPNDAKHDLRKRINDNVGQCSGQAVKEGRKSALGEGTAIPIEFTDGPFYNSK
jgi:hypothetical protein